MKTNFSFSFVHSGENQLLREVIRSAGISKRALTEIKFNGGKIQVNDEEVTVLKEVQSGDYISIDFPPEEMSEGLVPVYEDLPLLFEDEHFLIVNKPAGLPSIPSRDHPNDSVANRLAGYYRMNNYATTVHLVTRLDKDTSGLILVAKHRHAHHKLSEQLQQNTIKKHYLALTEGVLKPEMGEVIAPIGRVNDSIIKRCIAEDGKYAKTTFTRLFIFQESQPFSLVTLQLWTGRTHQIRVHMASIGHPLVGDELYGGSIDRLSRQALHAHHIIFNHPLTSEQCEFWAPIPEDFSQLLEGRQLP